MSKWIRSNDRLPSYGDPVLVIYRDPLSDSLSYAAIANYISGVWFLRTPVYPNFTPKIVYWMELPEIPYEL